jgi:8-oxo-dGTP diphosphatase
MTASRSAPRGRGPAFPCARCGTPIRREPGHPPKLRCPVCRYRIYDYPRPCAGVILLRGDDVLVLRRGDPPKRGFLDTPGGFIDAGETLEGAARRELLEETGTEAGKLELLGYYWDRYFLKGFGFFPTLNFYFLGRWKRGVPKAGDDAASAEWVPLADRELDERLAWKHMGQVLRDARKRALSGRRSRPSRA